MSSIRVSAFGKINLYLSIESKRLDGYHNIQTVFQMIDLSDLITIKTVDSGIHIVSNMPIPLDSSNLAYKAAEIFFKETNINKGAEIYIKKRIPVGSGLAGGTSDGISTLLSLNALYKNPLTKKQIFNIAKTIGADGPFFTVGGTVLAEGVGDIIKESFSCPEMYFLIYFPKFRVSTKWAYNNISSKFLTNQKKDINILLQALRGGEKDRIYKGIFNVFEPLIFEKYGELRVIKDFMLKNNAKRVTLCGSGSALVGFFDTATEAFYIQGKVSNSGNFWVAKPVRGDIYLKQFNQWED